MPSAWSTQAVAGNPKRAKHIHPLQFFQEHDRRLAGRLALQTGALVALQQVDEGQRQAVLDEWAARCGGSTVRNPAGYLFGIVQKAIRGEFRAWAGQGDARSPPTTSSPASAVSKAPSPELAQAHIARLRSMLERP